MLPVLTDGSNRTAQQDVVLVGHLVPKGTMVWLFFNGLFNSTASWGDPAVYRPVRPLLTPVLHGAQPALRRAAEADEWPAAGSAGGCCSQVSMQERWEARDAEYLPPAGDKPAQGVGTTVEVDAHSSPQGRAQVCACASSQSAAPQLQCAAASRQLHGAGRQQGAALDALQRRAARLRGPEPGAHELRDHCGHAAGPLLPAPGPGDRLCAVGRLLVQRSSVCCCHQTAARSPADCMAAVQGYTLLDILKSQSMASMTLAPSHGIVVNFVPRTS